MNDRAPELARFPPTRWTLVKKAARGESGSFQALGDLCAAYWYPLYAFARRNGRSVEDAQDLTQGFFDYLLKRNLFAAADRDLGKLRTFLLTAYERYIRDHDARDRAGKRGGPDAILSLDALAGEARYAREPVDSLSPARLFERSWAFAVIEGAMAALRAREAKAGREVECSVLEPFIAPLGGESGNYAAAAATLKMNEPAVRQAVSRLRGRFREVLRQQIADTLDEPTDAAIREELAFLSGCVRG